MAVGTERSNSEVNPLSRKALLLVARTSVLLVVFGSSTACGGSSAQAVISSPTPDSVTQNYVALIRNYWIQIQTADEASSSANVAATVCLGQVTRGAAR